MLDIYVYFENGNIVVQRIATYSIRFRHININFLKLKKLHFSLSSGKFNKHFYEEIVSFLFKKKIKELKK